MGKYEANAATAPGRWLPLPPRSIELFVERRKRLGQDVHDEVWEGTYHMSPAAHGYLADQLARLLGP